jgi:hypothetical protein
MSAYFRLDLLTQSVAIALAKMSKWEIYWLCRQYGFTVDEIEATGLTCKKLT